jgi:hypothetical protein
MEQVDIDKMSKLAETLDKAGFSDRTDVSAEVSLLEYGLMRNPTTNRVIYAMPADVSNSPCFDWTIIDLDDVKEFLDEAPKGFYDFIGSNKAAELDGLHNNYLTNIISAANMYNGWFQQSCVWNYTIDSIAEQIIA